MSGSWPITRAEELIEVLDHLRVPVNSDERAKRLGDVPYYGANGQQGWIDRPLFNEPLVLLAEDGGNFDDFRTRPIAYRIDGPAWVNNHAHIIRALAGVDQDFVFWSLVHRDIRRYIAGGTRSKLTQAELRSIELLTPPLPEQRRIAEILDTLDEAIRKTEQVIAKLQQMKQGLLHDLLTRGIDENGELRDPERHPEQFQDSPLGRIPKAWQVAPLSVVTDMQVGFAFKSEWFRESGRVRLLRGENVGYGTADWKQARFLPDVRVEEFSEYLLNEGDVVIGMDRTFTKSGVKVTVLGADDLPALLVQRVGRFQPSRFTREFLRQVLSWPIFLRSLTNQQKGMDIPHLSKSEILAPLISIPPESEQVAIANRLTSVDAKLTAETNSALKLRTLKHGLMDDLLTGRVRVAIPVEANA